jgi:hypothetical protein
MQAGGQVTAPFILSIRRLCYLKQAHLAGLDVDCDVVARLIHVARQGSAGVIKRRGSECQTILSCTLNYRTIVAFHG